MKIANIKYCDIANGPGCRTSVFVSGCTNNCPGCFNKEAQSFDFGYLYTPEVKNEILKSLDNEYISGITLLGGDPMEPKNQEGVLDILTAVKEKYPTKNIWTFTGFLYENLSRNDSYTKTVYTDKILNLLDVLVDGPFVQEKYAIDLLFRGSSNQRIIDVKRTLKEQKIVMWTPTTV